MLTFSIQKNEIMSLTDNDNLDLSQIAELVQKSFKNIAPLWPLKNLIATNPLQGLEELPFEEALKESSKLFETEDLPTELKNINRETIKWLQAFYDEGQAKINMPFKEFGLYTAWKELSVFDEKIHLKSIENIKWLKSLPAKPNETIKICLEILDIDKSDYELFLTLLLTTLPGWASYIKYKSEWEYLDSIEQNRKFQFDYLAMRIAITTLLWKEANQILNLYHNKKPKTNLDNLIKSINFAEEEYSHTLLEKISQNKLKQIKIPEAQIVFCIDVRSEPFRLCLEKTGKYETFGYAGFFGIPAKIKNTINNEYYNSCPVLLSPKHLIKKTIFSDKKVKLRHYFFLTELKKLYQSVKYNFTTPFALVESIGIFNGLFIWLRNFFPNLAYKIGFGRNEDLINNSDYDYLIDNIKFEDKCQYAESALKMIGLTKNFAKLVVFCGHVGCTQNNAYASSLDCGACAGRNGSNNSNILVKILNDFSIRKFLSSKGYKIPDTTVFIAGEHNTTTDQVTLMTSSTLPEIQALKANLEKARIQNNISRLKKLGHNVPKNKALKHALKNSQDWSQVRPEWGLANNAAFIIGPRNYTDSIDLDGRCFLHSYDYTNDIDGQILTNILTAPMVVAQWINSQYLFSSLNNVTYGGGSKITKNITGKIGIMQGNASDLMTGLSLQSVYSSDLNKYHTTQRLITVVFASRLILKKIIKSQFVLQKLFGNGWVKLICIEPDTKKTYFLNRDYSWKMYN